MRSVAAYEQQNIWLSSCSGTSWSCCGNCASHQAPPQKWLHVHRRRKQIPKKTLKSLSGHVHWQQAAVYYQRSRAAKEVDVQKSREKRIRVPMEVLTTTTFQFHHPPQALFHPKPLALPEVARLINYRLALGIDQYRLHCLWS
ncbi:hypothetical protein Y1Q_0014531 [Alligator mississippiensis]|uniref:Uncharacterized protein n=1 Tax=Alligator mississippiensis TaxID=8496 RepID=A0A151PD45_ALLMI|nr:hypothetical protein Y1Q_0014531 [Alligator mississippiensis]